MVRYSSADSVKCPVCGFGYVATIAKDRRDHERHHELSWNHYYRTQQRLSRMREVRWTGRAPVEIEGAYLAMNEANPRMKGFACHFDEDFTPKDWSMLQMGLGEVVPDLMEVDYCARGNGHNRSGIWYAPDGQAFGYSANWRAGCVSFWPK
jgi:hypothetical protein